MLWKSTVTEGQGPLSASA